MTTRIDTSRKITAPRGAEISCKGWLQEGALRMLHNNLDPEVAEKPDELIVYGGIGKAARNWESFDLIVKALRDLENDETLLVQSGKPVAILRSHADAPRVLIANSNLVPNWATWEHFRELDKKGLMMYGQMTAGSWIYIGSQGIVQGTYETYLELANQHFGGSLSGRLNVTAGLGGMGGAQPLAITMNNGVCLAAEMEEWRVRKRLETRYIDEMLTDIDEAIDRALEAKNNAEAVSIGVVCNAIDLLRRMLERGVAPDTLTDQTSAHDPLNGYYAENMSVEESKTLRAENPELYIEKSKTSIAEHVKLMLAIQRKGADYFRLRQQHSRRSAGNGRNKRFRFSRFCARVHSSAVLQRERTVSLGRAFGRSRRYKGDRRQTPRTFLGE